MEGHWASLKMNWFNKGNGNNNVAPKGNSLLVPPSAANYRRDSAAVGTLHELAPSKDLKKALECPICKEVPLAPIYTCSSGHTICGKCRKDQRCGICQEDLSKTARNATVELIVANSSFWCKYLSDGCPKIIKGIEYRDHLSDCEYRRIECFEIENKKCSGEQLRFKDYFKHLQDTHDVQGFDMPMATLTMSEYSNSLASDGPWPMYYLQYDKEIFLRHMKTENSIVYWWFTMIGSKEDAAHYKVKVSIYMKHDEASKVEWIVPIYSVRTPRQELETCFQVAIPAKQLEKYCIQRKHPHGEMFKYVMDLKYEIFTT